MADTASSLILNNVDFEKSPLLCTLVTGSSAKPPWSFALRELIAKFAVTGNLVVGSLKCNTETYSIGGNVWFFLPPFGLVCQHLRGAFRMCHMAACTAKLMRGTALIFTVINAFCPQLTLLSSYISSFSGFFFSSSSSCTLARRDYYSYYP